MPSEADFFLPKNIQGANPMIFNGEKWNGEEETSILTNGITIWKWNI
jgi:hypothetical protein